MQVTPSKRVLKPRSTASNFEEVPTGSEHERCSFSWVKQRKQIEGFEAKAMASLIKFNKFAFVIVPELKLVKLVEVSSLSNSIKIFIDDFLFDFFDVFFVEGVFLEGLS